MPTELACSGPPYQERPDGENDDEIDQNKFENAVGARGIEQLVGVRVRKTREGRRFWTRADD